MNATIGLILMFSGIAIYFVGWLWFLVAAFREGILWGVACLLIPIVQLIFLIMHWHAAKKPFGLQVLGLALIIAALIFAPQPAHR